MTDGYDLKLPNDSTRKINFLWGNMKEEGVLVDYYTLRMVQNIRMQLTRLTDELIQNGENENALAILDKTFEIMPIDNNQVPTDEICFYLCKNYYAAGDTLKGDALGKKLVALELDKLKHFLTFEDRFLNHVWPELGKAMSNLEMLRESSIKNSELSSIQEFNYFYKNSDVKQAYASLAAAADNPNNPSYFNSLGILKDTDFISVCMAVKGKFNEHLNDKQNYFYNPQKFPIYYSIMWSGNRINSLQ